MENIVACSVFIQFEMTFLSNFGNTYTLKLTIFSQKFCFPKNEEYAIFFPETDRQIWDLEEEKNFLNLVVILDIMAKMWDKLQFWKNS